MTSFDLILHCEDLGGVPSTNSIDWNSSFPTVRQRDVSGKKSGDRAGKQPPGITMQAAEFPGLERNRDTWRGLASSPEAELWSALTLVPHMCEAADCIGSRSGTLLQLRAEVGGRGQRRPPRWRWCPETGVKVDGSLVVTA